MPSTDTDPSTRRDARVSLTPTADALVDRLAAAHCCSRPEVTEFALRSLEASANPSLRELLEGVRLLDGRVALLAETNAAILELLVLREYAAHESLTKLMQQKTIP